MKKLQVVAVPAFRFYKAGALAVQFTGADADTFEAHLAAHR